MPTTEPIQQKESIVKGTKEGALYLVLSELLAQPDIKELIAKLEKSKIRKKILEASRNRAATN